MPPEKNEKQLMGLYFDLYVIRLYDLMDRFVIVQRNLILTNGVMKFQTNKFASS